MAEIIEVNNTTQFEEVYDKVSQEHENFVIVFTGATDADTGKSWCPDCIVHKESIQTNVLQNF